MDRQLAALQEPVGSRITRRVVKVGGSLLKWPPLPGILRKWLQEQPPAVNVLLCGGGPLADVVRRADRDFSLGEETAHWLCIDALSLSARFLVALLGDVRLVSSLDELRGTVATAEHAIIVFDPRAFLYDDEKRLPGRPLPHNWSVTSDSIAARLAEALTADELVLLKSANPPATALTELAALEFVDRYFPIAAHNAPRSRFVNLRPADL